MYASTNSCVDTLHKEGDRDPADPDCRQGRRLRKWRREIGADAPLRQPMEEMRTCQCEHLAAETTADKNARLQLMSALQHKPKRLAAESATERDIRFYSE